MIEMLKKTEANKTFFNSMVAIRGSPTMMKHKRDNVQIANIISHEKSVRTHEKFVRTHEKSVRTHEKSVRVTT